MSRIRKLREQLGFGLREVALAADWSLNELKQIERDDHELDESDARKLEDLYGVDIDAWLDSSGDDAHSPVGLLLRSQQEELSAWTRFTIAEATTVARDVRSAQRHAGEATGWEKIEAIPQDPDHRHPETGNAERLAMSARKHCGIMDGPVASMSKVFADLGILVLWTELPPHIDALSMAQEDLGGVMVANLRGKHMTNAYLRRITFAHELCHILFDRTWMAGLRNFCCTGSRSSGHSLDNVERRARAFTTYFLAPRDAVAAMDARDDTDLVRKVMDRYGMGYEATRHHLKYVANIPIEKEVDDVSAEVPPRWDAQDPLRPADHKAVAVGVPELRAGAATEIVLSLYRASRLTSSVASELLRINPKSWDELLLARRGLTDQTWATSSAADTEWQ